MAPDSGLAPIPAFRRGCPSAAVECASMGASGSSSKGKGCCCCCGRRYDDSLTDLLLEDDVAEDATILVVFLHGCSDLPAADLDGAADPYVVLTYGEQRLVSSGRAATLQPVWDPPEVFRFVVEDMSEPFALSVFDSDMVGDDDCMGDSVVHLDRYVGKACEKESLPLINPETGRRDCGAIHVEIWVTNRENAFARRTDELYEYNRFHLASGAWGTKFLPTDPNRGRCEWSEKKTGTDKPRFAATMAELADGVPEGWELESNWTFQVSQSNEDGWCYAGRFRSTKWYDDAKASSFVRRRRWVRVLRKARQQEAAAEAAGAAGSDAEPSSRGPSDTSKVP